MPKKASRAFKGQNPRGKDSLSQQNDLRRVGKLSPELKVNMTIDLTETMTGTCMEGIRVQNPNVSEEELREKLRERFDWAKRWQKPGGAAR